MPRRIFTPRKILVATTGVAAVTYVLLSRRSPEHYPPVGNLMPAPPMPTDAAAEPHLRIDAKTIERVGRGELQMALVKIDASNEVEYVDETTSKTVRGREVKWTVGRGLGQGSVSAARLPVDDTRLVVGRSYAVAYRAPRPGDPLPFALEIAGLDDTNGRDLDYVAAYSRLLEMERLGARHSSDASNRFKK